MEHQILEPTAAARAHESIIHRHPATGAKHTIPQPHPWDLERWFRNRQVSALELVAKVLAELESSAGTVPATTALDQRH
jgi:hypothetical protein